MLWDPVISLLEECGMEAGPVLPRLEKHLALLLERGRKEGLTSYKTPEEMICHHFLDSLQLARFAGPAGEEKWIDVGSGAGFPGWPLRVVWPLHSLLSVDSRRKAGRFLDMVLAAIGSTRKPGDSVQVGRAEKLGREPGLRERFDVGVARAVAQPPVALEYLLPFVRPGGTAYLWVGPSFKRGTIENALDHLGGELSAMNSYELPRTLRPRFILEIKKRKPTPQRYPRTAGIPRKRPL